VGTGGNYGTLSAAISALNSGGVSGHVRFLLTDASYTITDSLVIYVLTNAPNASRTVTVKPAAGQSPLISGSINNAGLVRIRATNYVTIDGSNVDGGTSRDLTLRNTSTTTPNVVHIGCQGLTPITNVTLKNCIIQNGSVGTTSAGTGAVIVANYPTVTDSGYFSNITIENNKIGNASIGLFVNGSGDLTSGHNVTVRNNTLVATSATSPPDSIMTAGIQIRGVDGVSVAGNEIAGFKKNTEILHMGIWLDGGTRNAIVENNKIHDLNFTGSTGYGAIGIVVATDQLSSNNTLRNNMIWNLTGDGDDINNSSYPSLIYNPMGIYAGPRLGGDGTQSGLSMYFNTIYLYGNTLNYNANAASFGIVLDAGTSATIRNNIIVNNLGRKASTGIGAIGIWAVTNNSQFIGVDYNDYICAATGSGGNYVGRIGSSNYLHIANFQAASGGDVHSIERAITFVSTSDPHLSGGSVGDLTLVGIPISGITTDIDGNLRDALAPYIGADEAAVALPITLSSFEATVSGGAGRVSLEWTTLSEVDNYGFFIERRQENVGSFAEISGGFVPGNGTTAAVHSYSCVDRTVTAAGVYFYRLRQVDLDGGIHYSPSVAVNVPHSAIAGEIPAEFNLLQNYPNPFNPSTTLRYGLPERGRVTLTVFNTLGQEVSTLVNEEQEAGYHEVRFDGASLASGVYFYRLKSGNFVETKKFALVR